MFQTILDWLMPEQSRKELQDEIDSLHRETRDYCDALATAHSERLAAEHERDAAIKERDVALSLMQATARNLARTGQVIETLSKAVAERDAVIEKVRDVSAPRHISMRLFDIMSPAPSVSPTEEPPSQPDVGDGWRELGPDEILREGDEGQYKLSGAWVWVFVDPRYAGQPVGSGHNWRYRRRVTAEAQMPPVFIGEPVATSAERAEIIKNGWSDEPIKHSVKFVNNWSELTADVDVGEGWVALQPGEVLREGDECASGETNEGVVVRWSPTIRAGDVLRPGHRYRRRVTECRPTDAEADKTSQA